MNRQRKLFSADHELFRDTVARFIADEITPHHYQWEQDGLVPVSYTHLTLPTKA